MARYGSCNFEGLYNIRDELNRINGSINNDKTQAFIEECARELAARLLGKVIRRTPVGQYPKGAGKVGGTLRRGWTAGTSDAKAYAQSLNVRKQGYTYTIEVSNPVEYAWYVENGHRTKGGQGFVPGVFMLKIPEEEIQAAASGILAKKLAVFLEECFS